MPAAMQRLVVATHNPGKLREFGGLLAPLGIEVVAQGDLGIGEADEPHVTFVENALAKARHASAASGLPALADDSGLCVDALAGAPGVRSARYAEAAADADRATRDRANNARLVDALVGQHRRDAYYFCCLVLLRQADDPEPLVAFGRWHGTVVAEARGTEGFGYDAHFLLPDLGLTVAELDRETKNRISHRALAMTQMIDLLRVRGLGAAR
jgi:XTP/dITP diphosphohydrolase